MPTAAAHLYTTFVSKDLMDNETTELNIGLEFNDIPFHWLAVFIAWLPKIR